MKIVHERETISGAEFLKYLLHGWKNAEVPKGSVWHVVSDHSKGQREPLRELVILELGGDAGSIL